MIFSDNASSQLFSWESFLWNYVNYFVSNKKDLWIVLGIDSAFGLYESNVILILLLFITAI